MPGETRPGSRQIRSGPKAPGAAAGVGARQHRPWPAGLLGLKPKRCSTTFPSTSGAARTAGQPTGLSTRRVPPRSTGRFASSLLHRRPTYHKPCRWKEEGIVVAPVPEEPIGGAVQPPVPCPADRRDVRPSRPIERIVAALRVEGLEIPKASLVRGLRAVSLLASRSMRRSAPPTERRLTWISRDELAGLRRSGGKGEQALVAVGLRPVDTVCSSIDPTRSSSVLAPPRIDLSGTSLEPGRSPIVSSDFYAVYQSLASLGGIEALWCVHTSPVLHPSRRCPHSPCPWRDT
jgi:hypothetical protein